MKNGSGTSTGSFEELNEKILHLEKQIKLETENNTQLEQYTRCENLRFNNVKETEREDCKSLISEKEDCKSLISALRNTILTIYSVVLLKI